jgi:hypothetical protein
VLGQGSCSTLVEASESLPKADDGGGSPDEPKPAAPQPRSQQAAAERGSVLGLRAALWFQLIIMALTAPWAYTIALGFTAMAGYTTEDVNSFTSRFIAFVILPLTVHLLAAIQVGRAAWGVLYLMLSMFATVVQIVVLLPWFIVPAVPFVIALVIELASLADKDTRARVEVGSSPRWSVLPELILIPLAIAAIVGLAAWNGNVNDIENRHPARNFDGSEAPAVLTEAIEEPRRVIEAIDGFPEAEAHGDVDDSPCGDGAGWDDEWSVFELGYRYEGLSPHAGAGLEALETMREWLPEHGWEITRDEPWGHSQQLRAQRDDGVKLSFDVGEAFTRLDVHSGCVENAETTPAS